MEEQTSLAQILGASTLGLLLIIRFVAHAESIRLHSNIISARVAQSWPARLTDRA